MASTGFTLVGAGSNVDSADAGASIWSDPGNITADDSTYATNSNTGNPTDFLRGTQLGFSIPTDATIDGIEVRFERKSTAFFGTTFNDKSIRLVKAGTAVGDNKSAGASWPTTDATADYGGVSDLWGTTWTAAEVNATDFGCDIQATNPTSTITASVDAVWINVHYTESGSTDDLLANDVESSSEVTSPSIGQTHGLNASDVQSTSEVTSPSLGQAHALTANDVESASNVSAPALTEVVALTANDVESASEVTSPSIGQTHALTANDVQSVSELTSPAVGQVHGLAANDVESASEMTEPALAVAGGRIIGLSRGRGVSYGVGVSTPSRCSDPDVPGVGI